MHIQWYPGHMTKAMRMMEENVKLVDSVIYILDSRCIAASFNPSFDKLIGNKPVLYVFNKADTVEKSDLNAWVRKLTGEGKHVMCINSTADKCQKVVDMLRLINKPMLDRYAAKGAKKSVRAMVIGIPNSGKSTFINALCGSKRTLTGDRPGVTRGKQWVTLGVGVELLDTPGTLWPSFENQNYAAHLAFVGSINEDVLNIEELALEMIAFFRENYPQNFLTRCKLESFCEKDIDTLELSAKKRGFILKGGLCDTQRAASSIIDDFRKQRFGKIMLERADG